MQNEKIETIMSEFYKVKAEVTTGELSLKRSYLLYKKLLLIDTFLLHCLTDLDNKRMNYRKQINNKINIFLIINILSMFLTIFCFPLGLITTTYLLFSLKKINKEIEEFKSVAKENTKIGNLADLVNNIIEILRAKISKIEITVEEHIKLTKEIIETPAKEVFDKKMLAMFSQNPVPDNLTLEQFEDNITNEDLINNIIILIRTKN